MSFFQFYRDQYKRILSLAIPVVLAQLGVVLVQLFDNAMVGRLVGIDGSPLTLPLAAVSFAGTVFFLLFILLFGILQAITPLVGKVHIQGDNVAAVKYLQNGFLISVLVSLLVFAILYLIIPLLYYMGQPVEVVDMAIPYYKYLAWSIIPFMIFISFKQFFEGLGNTKINMFIIMFSSLLNIFFNWLFIYGHWGFPRMEAEGAGLATFLSRLVMPFMAIFLFCFSTKFKTYFHLMKSNYLEWKTLALILSVGIPIALQMFMEGAAFALASIMMGWIGAFEIAANQIAFTVSNFSFMIIIGLSSAATICMSHEYGRNNISEMQKLSKAAFQLTLIYSTTMALLFVFFRTHIAAIFTADPEVIKLASFFLIFVAAFQLSDGLQITAVGLLRGIQDVKRIAIVAFVAYILINLPLGWLLTFVFGIGPVGLWIGFIVGLSLAALLLIIRLKTQLRRIQEKFNR